MTFFFSLDLLQIVAGIGFSLWQFQNNVIGVLSLLNPVIKVTRPDTINEKNEENENTVKELAIYLFPIIGLAATYKKKGLFYPFFATATLCSTPIWSFMSLLYVMTAIGGWEQSEENEIES